MHHNTAVEERDRLESWKAIARHFARSERTVRRWESREGLPVYRHPHRKGNSVYAFVGELDAWREQRTVASSGTVRLEPELAQPEAQDALSATQPLPDHKTRTTSSSWYLPTRIGLLAALIAVLALTLMHPVLPPTLNPGARTETSATPSPFANKKFSRAVQLWRDGQFNAAQTVLEALVAQDSDFAVAHAELAWLRFTRGQQAGAVEAAQDAAHATVRQENERRYVQAARALVAGDVAETIVALNVLVAADESNPLFLFKLVNVCLMLRAPSQCVNHATALSRIDPERLDSALLTARVHASAGVGPTALWAHAARLENLLHDSDVLERPKLATDVAMFRARVAWGMGDLEASLGALEGPERVFARWPGRAQAMLAKAVAEHLLALGRFGDADAWFDKIPSARLRHEARAMGLFARFDMAGLKNHLSNGTGYGSAFTAVMLSAVGDEARALELVDRLAQLTSSVPSIEILRGRLAVDAGHAMAAIPSLRDGISMGHSVEGQLRMLGADTLSAILDDAGAPLEALAILESSLDSPMAAALDGAGAVWLICQSRLARLYRRLGRKYDARRVDETIARQLQRSDPRHPLLASSHG